MKNISDMNKTNVFCLLGGDVRNLAAISAHYGDQIVAVGKTKDMEIGQYAVRRIYRDADDAVVLEDVVVEVWGSKVEVVDKSQVCRSAA